jgi:predicted Zn-dependent peptidase
MDTDLSDPYPSVTSVQSVPHSLERTTVPSEIYHHTFANGLTLLAERMEHVRSAALNFLIPAGYVYDPADRPGLASVLSEWITRGAGSRNSRQLTLALDNLGLDHSESVGAMHMRFWGATLAANLRPSLELYADILRRPKLSKNEVDAVKDLAIQEIQGIEDEPKQKVMIELRRRHYPSPLGRDRNGTVEGVKALTADEVRSHFRQYFQPRGAILSIAGNVQWEPLRDQVAELFGDWEPGEEPTIKQRKPPGGRAHLEKETTQTQIALAYPSVPFGHPDYYAAHGAVQVLSGGMSGRLFTEVREKRGLCYSVWASYQTFKECAAILCYAGTTNERAQETLSVTLGELRRLEAGVEEEELDRVKAGLKSALIMQEESTSARAGALATDWYYLGRVRSLEEIQSAVNNLTPQTIVEYARHYPPEPLTLVTLGPKPLRVPRARKDASAVTENGSPLRAAR